MGQHFRTQPDPSPSSSSTFLRHLSVCTCFLFCIANLLFSYIWLLSCKYAIKLSVQCSVFSDPTHRSSDPTRPDPTKNCVIATHSCTKYQFTELLDKLSTNQQHTSMHCILHKSQSVLKLHRVFTVSRRQLSPLTTTTIVTTHLFTLLRTAFLNNPTQPDPSNQCPYLQLSQSVTHTLTR